MHLEGPGLLPGRTLVPVSEAAPGLLRLGEPQNSLEPWKGLQGEAPTHHW